MRLVRQRNDRYRNRCRSSKPQQRNGRFRWQQKMYFFSFLSADLAKFRYVRRLFGVHSNELRQRFTATNYKLPFYGNELRNFAKSADFLGFYGNEFTATDRFLDYGKLRQRKSVSAGIP